MECSLLLLEDAEKQGYKQAISVAKCIHARKSHAAELAHGAVTAVLMSVAVVTAVVALAVTSSSWMGQSLLIVRLPLRYNNCSISSHNRCIGTMLPDLPCLLLRSINTETGDQVMLCIQPNKSRVAMISALSGTGVRDQSQRMNNAQSEPRYGCRV